MIHLEDVRHLIAAYFIAKLDRYEGLTAEEHSTPGALLHAMGAIGQTHDRANAALRGHRVLTMLLRGRSTNPITKLAALDGPAIASAASQVGRRMIPSFGYFEDRGAAGDHRLHRLHQNNTRSNRSALAHRGFNLGAINVSADVRFGSKAEMLITSQ